MIRPSFVVWNVDALAEVAQATVTKHFVCQVKVPLEVHRGRQLCTGRCAGLAKAIWKKIPMEWL